jgi:hypothetical protein
VRQVGDDVFRVDDLDVVRRLDVGSGDDTVTVLAQLKVTSSRLCSLKTTPLRFSRMLTTSSWTPSMDEYSCRTPAIVTSVAA